MKKYISPSDISIVVELSDKSSARISFSSISGGHSVFYTDDAEVQKALEKHYRFGKLFYVDNDNPIDTKQPQPDPVDTGEKEIIRKEFGDWEEAKDYLAEKFEVNRTKLKTTAAIKKAALAYNVELVVNE